LPGTSALLGSPSPTSSFDRRGGSRVIACGVQLADTGIAGCRRAITEDKIMSKTVDVYVKDRLVASYPLVAKDIDRPTDDDFIERTKQQMRLYYRSEDIEAAKFVVRG
jgi:hypothetical protein